MYAHQEACQSQAEPNIIATRIQNGTFVEKDIPVPQAFLVSWWAMNVFGV